MSELLSSITGGSNAGLKLIQTMNNPVRVTVSGNLATVSASQSSAIFNTYTEDTTPMLFDTATLQQAANTAEQTIVDTGTGVSGVFTGMYTNILDVGQTATVRVYIDNTVKTFTFTAVVADYIGLLGSVRFVSGSSAGSSQHYGSDADTGYDDLGQMYFLNPIQAIYENIGIVFNNSLKVTIQGDTTLQAGSTSNFNVVAWATTIPEGL